MPTRQQKKEIEKLMRRIKDAKDDEEKTKEDIMKRTQDLYNYLVQEGMVIPEDE